MKALIVADIDNGKIRKITREILGAVKAKSATAEVLLVGGGVAGLGAELGGFGADKVYVAEVDGGDPSAILATVEQAVMQAGPDAVLFGATWFGKDVSVRLAARLGVGLATECVDIAELGDSIEFIRPVYAGKALAKVRMNKRPAMASIRGNSFPVPEETGGQAEVVELAAAGGDGKVSVKELKPKEAGMIPLTEADIIVSGGRGIKEAEDFGMLRELCSTLGAALGASRAVVDAGLIEHAHQVGQTGKTVSPQLYIACGISGAIQHLAGMSTSKFIVAINKDEHAPIFKMADLGLVGDIYKAVPLLTEEFKKALSG
jgi:electron transfer flavoprotein alpha subunit